MTYDSLAQPEQQAASMVTYVIHTFFAGITRPSVRQDYSLLRAKIHPQGSHGCSHAEYMWSALLHDWGKEVMSAPWSQ